MNNIDINLIDNVERRNIEDNVVCYSKCQLNRLDIEILEKMFDLINDSSLG